MKAAEPMFDPPLSELEAVVHRLVSTIIQAAQGLPRVLGHVSLCMPHTAVCVGGACVIP